MKILVRFDDICPTMDWRQWHIAEEYLDKYNIKPLLGVIPDCRDKELMIDPLRKDFWEWVKVWQTKGAVVAMHGVYHVYTTHDRGLVSNGNNSEFAGLPYKKQYDLLTRGKEILRSHGISTDVFFAPSHSYDLNTLKALSALEFRYVSDGKTFKPVVRSGIRCIPCKSRIKYLDFVDEYQTEVFHTSDWRRKEKEYSFKKFVDLCANPSIVSWQEFIDRKDGNVFCQSLYEQYFLVLERKVVPLLRKIRKIIYEKISDYKALRKSSATQSME